MSRKKTRGKNRSAPLSSTLDPIIARMLRQMGMSVTGRSPVDRTPVKEQEKKEQTHQEWLESWRDAARGLYSAHSQKQHNRAFMMDYSVRLLTVDRTHGCTAELTCENSSYHLNWHFDPVEFTFGITSKCGHRGMCEHTACMARYLIDELRNEDSELVAKILDLDRSSRVLQKTVSMLQALTRNAQQEHRQVDHSAADPQTLTRFVWDLQIDKRLQTATLKPCLQQEKKSGGWTKGRETSLESFLKSPRDQWTETDQQIADRIRHERWQTPVLGLAEALPVLVGSDQFSMDREPASLSSVPLEIIAHESEGGLLLSTSATDLLLRQPPEIPHVFVDLGRGVLIVFPDQHQAIHYTGPAHSAAICQQLLKHRDAVPPERQSEVLQELQSLQNCMTVRLPASLAGEEVPCEGQLALLLQLRRNGMLDATLQFRDHRQFLHTPGEGLARIHETVDGQPRQVVRQLADEVQRAAAMASELRLKRGVPLSRWGWRIPDADDISELLTAAGALVEQNRLVVLWHQDSVSRFDVIGRLSPQNVRVDVTRQRDWFGLSGTCRIGDQEIPLKDLLTSVNGRLSNGLLEITPGKWAAVAEELRTALRRLADVSLESRGRLQLDASAAPIVSTLEAARIQVTADKHWEKCLKRLREAEELTFEPPAGLNAQLRDYQRDGFQWLARLAHWGIGGILADDMGLGKTVQALAVLLARMGSGPALVIAPTSLGFNWQRECEKFAPALNPILFRDVDRLELKDRVSDGDLVICSYGLALREAELLKDIKWGTLILDEAQNIKNSNSKTAAQIRTFEAEWKIALTGTPMENHLGELWSLFHTVAPGVLGSWEQFRRRFATSIEKNGDNDRRRALSSVIAPFVLRRSKADVLKDLPERTEMNLLVDLSTEERMRYDQMRLAAVSELTELGDDSLSQDQRFKVLQMLTRLRQLSCHIGLVDDTWQGSSSKLELLMEQLEQLKERGNRPLIFSQFTSHLALIRAACDKAGISYQYLDGQTTPPQRRERVDAFQNGTGDVFLISLKAGGTGLNLTAADYVIHMDPWWNPAVEDQATDRAHRIGQTRPVIVYRIIARGTIEEQILKLHDEKRDLVDGVLSGADAAARLSTQELADLIRQGVEVPTMERL